MTVQHTMTVRIDKQIVKINCPPYQSDAALDRLLAEYREAHPTHVIVSKSWRSPNAPT